MKFAKFYRNGILLLPTVAIFFVLVSIGCLQSNKSKIVGSWKTQPIDNIDGSVQYTLFKFYKEGIVSKKTVIVINEQSPKKNNKKIGKYKFKDDNNNILITWDDGNSETMNVSFPQENKMILGKYEMKNVK